MGAISKSKTKLQLALIIAVLGLILFFSGYLYYQHEKEANRRYKYIEIHAKSKFKADQLSIWLKERLSEVTFFSSNDSYPEYIKGMLSDNSEYQVNYRNSMAHILKDTRFQNVF